MSQNLFLALRITSEVPLMRLQILINFLHMPYGLQYFLHEKKWINVLNALITAV